MESTRRGESGTSERGVSATVGCRALRAKRCNRGVRTEEKASLDIRKDKGKIMHFDSYLHLSAQRLINQNVPMNLRLLETTL